MTATAISPAQVMNSPGYQDLKSHIIRVTGLEYFAARDQELASLMAARFKDTGVDSCDAYLALLGGAGAGSELDALITRLTNGETYFFRHAQLWESLRESVIPELLQLREDKRSLRIWSAGCSNGAEPYSLSILLQREFAGRLADWDLSIVATDINRDFLKRACEGIFGAWTFRAMSDQMRSECFESTGDLWRIHDRFRDCVTFQFHNLVHDADSWLLSNLEAFDLILCRNVMIYFSPEIAEQTMAGLMRCLHDGGWLVPGPAETRFVSPGSLETVQRPGVVLFRKPRDGCAAPVVRPAGPDILARQALSSAIALPGKEYEPAPALPGHEPAWMGEQTRAPADTAADPGRRRDERPSPDTKPRAQTDADTEADDAYHEIRRALDRGDWKKALERSTHLIDEDPMRATHHLYHGLALEQIGHHGAAELALRRVLYLDRRRPEGHYYLARVLQRRGRPDDAARSFETAIALLRDADETQTLQDADGIKAGELMSLASTHLEGIRSPS